MSAEPDPGSVPDSSPVAPSRLVWSVHPAAADPFKTLGVLLVLAVFLTFVIQVVTGIWQLFYFTPTTDHAYDSLNYLRIEVPFGWLIHGLHYWGASAMIVLVGLHMSRVFIWGVYKHQGY